MRKTSLCKERLFAETRPLLAWGGILEGRCDVHWGSLKTAGPPRTVGESHSFGVSIGEALRSRNNLWTTTGK